MCCYAHNGQEFFTTSFAYVYEAHTSTRVSMRAHIAEQHSEKLDEELAEAEGRLEDFFIAGLLVDQRRVTEAQRVLGPDVLLPKGKGLLQTHKLSNRESEKVLLLLHPRVVPGEAVKDRRAALHIKDAGLEVEEALVLVRVHPDHFFALERREALEQQEEEDGAARAAAPKSRSSHSCPFGAGLADPWAEMDPWSAR